MTEPDKSLDLLGIKPVAEAINTVTRASTAGVGAFLGRICLPGSTPISRTVELRP